MLTFFRLFDVLIASDLPLSGLPAWEERGDVEWTVQLGGSKRRDERGFEWIHEWKNARGMVTMACARRDGDYMLRFPTLADFRIGLESRMIMVYPASGTTMGTLSHLVVDQVLPRILGHLGRIVLHASSVVLPGIGGIAFCGDSGKGKSTLAASFCQAGALLVTDDCLAISNENGRLTALAAYPSLRLWPSSVDALYTGSKSFDTVTHYSTKQQFIAVDEQFVQRGEADLKAIFVLKDCGCEIQNETICIEPMPGAAAAMAMIEAAFVLDVACPQAVQENFQRVTALTATGVAMYSLEYPRSYDVLTRVQSRVTGILGG